MNQQVTYKTHFDDYLKSAFQLEVDLRFWKLFISNSIKNYQLENSENGWINEAEFSLYNLHPDGQNTWLYCSNDTSTIEINDLEKHSNTFFNWVMNLSIVRIYNAAELLLLNTIQLKYFPNLKPINNNKKNANRIIAEIKNDLISSGKSFDATNNRYIIEFLRIRSSEFESFLELKIKTDWTTTWKDFFELFSILRNIITHHAMTMTPDIRNSIYTVAKDAFKHYFFQPAKTTDVDILKTKSEHDFLNFISLVNDFVSNTVKYIAEEIDFNFIGLYKA